MVAALAIYAKLVGPTTAPAVAWVAYLRGHYDRRCASAARVAALRKAVPVDEAVLGGATRPA
jgi:hypothetical protein